VVSGAAREAVSAAERPTISVRICIAGEEELLPLSLPPRGAASRAGGISGGGGGSAKVGSGPAKRCQKAKAGKGCSRAADAAASAVAAVAAATAAVEGIGNSTAMVATEPQPSFEPLDEANGTWCDLPTSLPAEPLPVEMVRGPEAYNPDSGVWSDVPAPEWYDQAIAAATVGGVSREVLDAMITQALLIEDDALLRSLVSVQQFGSRSNSFSHVVALSQQHIG